MCRKRGESIPEYIVRESLTHEKALKALKTVDPQATHVMCDILRGFNLLENSSLPSTVKISILNQANNDYALKTVADAISMHESTVSRVTSNKYMATPRGIFELKYFFSSHVSTETGGECSSTAIRALIKKLVAAENRAKPLSDNKIAELIADQGIQVARRTIAKYRESLNIPSSSQRKSLL